MVYNNEIAFIDTNGDVDGDYYDDNYINITISDSIQRINQVIADGEHRWYNGSIDTPTDGDLTLKMSNSRIDLYKDLYLNGSSIGDTLSCNGNIETATTIKCNRFENNDNGNITFSHNGDNYFQFNKDTGVILPSGEITVPNDDATTKSGVFFECNRKVKAIEGFVGSLLNNDDASSAPRFTHFR